MIRLDSEQTRGLLKQPETGMGYQEVETELQGRPTRGFVFNAELLAWRDELLEAPVGGDYETLLRSATSARARELGPIRVLTGRRRVAGVVAERTAHESEGQPATDAQPEGTKDGEVFARFTAYRNDRRITQAGGLLPGTYATTGADAAQVKTGSQAVERYALPDPAPAIYRFRIEPLEGTIHRRGTVQPAYGHRGGGVEVLFDDGTDDGTVTGPDVLPP